MNSIFKLVKNGSCGINVIGLEETNDEYVYSFSDDTNFIQSDCVTLNTLTHITYDGTETLMDSQVLIHSYCETGGVLTYDYIDESTFEFTTDGHYVIRHIIIPTKSWITKMNAANANYALDYLAIIYHDLGQFYQLLGNNAVPLTVEEVINVTDSEATTTLVSSSQATFSICLLKECYYNLAKELLNALLATCKNNKYDDLIWRRDMLWMAINVIQYLLQKNQFLEASRILEWITGCGGLCPNEVKTDGGRNCGCHRNS